MSQDSKFIPFVADVVVHRLLAAALEIAKLPPIFQDGPQLTGIADSKKSNSIVVHLFLRSLLFGADIAIMPDLNYRHRNAQMASRASVELHTLIYFRTRYIILIVN